MRTIIQPHSVTVWLSASDTYNWAHKAGASWPCSFLSGRRVVAIFEGNGDLCDLLIDGGTGDQDCPGDEFSAIIADALRDKLEPSHSAYYGIVGQFTLTS